MQHLAMIMDGNRRWATENKLQAVTQGHRKGIGAVQEAINFCINKGIKHLSLYTFSLENFRRGSSEKDYIFKLLIETLEKNLNKFIEQGIRIRFIGDETFFPNMVVRSIMDVEEQTKHLKTLNLNMLFCYGAKQELIYAAKRVAQKVKSGLMEIDEIDEDALRSELWLNGVPDPDLVIRTGKEIRLSNFLLFQAAYSEWMFLDCYWPEIDQARLQQCYDRFYKTKRNFGT